MMGGGSGRISALPVHWVRISRSFYMGVTEVTQEQWKAVMGTEPWWGRSGGSKSGLPISEAGPANQIWWEDAQQFCRSLSEKTGCEVRLPTEAEWEYACRAGSDAAYCFGSSPTELSDYAWFGGLREDQPWTHRPQPVAQKKPNAWGLYDMHGNVEEWCQDLFDWDYYAESPLEDPTGPAIGLSGRVMRGGSRLSDAEDCGSGHRNRQPADVSSSLAGFRPVMELSTDVSVPQVPAAGKSRVPND